jgi:TPR repeat protein
MKLLLVIFLSSIISLAQTSTSHAPPGVKIKAASDADNTLAKTALERALVNGTSFPSELLGDTVTCGPTLWAALKGSADETLLHSKVVTALLSVPEPLQAVTRGLVTEEQRKAFWKLLLAKYPDLKTAIIRKASPDEIRYYWATIPFDIEEPLFSIQAGPQTFIANLRIEKNKPVLLWIDLVGDLHHLADQDLTADEVQELSTVSDAGMPISTYEVGRAYLLGRGVPVDMEKGRMWLDRAAQKGSLDAQMLLGAGYLSGTNLPKDPQLACKYLLQAAQQQNVVGRLRVSQALAQYWVALMFEQGRGVEKSHEKAIQYLQMAANNGSSPAQFDLAGMYNDGTGGMTMDKVRACQLFERAADQGNVKALHNIGYCYQSGTGGMKDDNKAIEFYRKAAEAGSVRSEHNLGIVYGQLGNAEKSYFWLRVAESSGDTENKTLIDTVKARLTASQLEAEDKEIVAWRDTHKANK